MPRRSKRIVVLGAGLLGVSTAWALLCDGHRVTVVDRHRGAGQGASFANGGHVATGGALPWTNLDFVFRLFRGAFRNKGAMRLHFRADSAQWRWLGRMIMNASSLSWGLRARCLLTLSSFSQACFESLQEELGGKRGLDFELSEKGILHLFSGFGAFVKARKHKVLMDRHGVKTELLDSKECVLKEKALSQAVADGHIGAGVFFPGDRTGDAQAFTEQLAQVAKARGCEFLLEHDISGVLIRDNRLAAILTSHGEIAGDIFVLALGVESVRFAGHFGLKLPIYPVRGYSATMRVNGFQAPEIGLVDEAQRIVISRLGNQLRIAGFADIGLKESDQADREALLLQAWDRVLPKSADHSSAEFWSGERPMTPDSLPILGPSGMLDNLYLNTGHGSLGWTLCHASAQLTADMIASRAPSLDPTVFSLSRFHLR